LRKACEDLPQSWSLPASLALGQNSGSATGMVQGVVLAANADGGRSVLPGARISLDGLSHLEAQSSLEGGFKRSAVPAGSHTITARIEATAATVSEVDLRIKVHVVTASTTVTASAEPAGLRPPHVICSIQAGTATGHLFEALARQKRAKFTDSWKPLITTRFHSNYAFLVEVLVKIANRSLHFASRPASAGVFAIGQRASRHIPRGDAFPLPEAVRANLPQLTNRSEYILT
jgi:hypothetical protein